MLKIIGEKIFSTISAAGGIVQNDVGDFLMIYRNNLWDLPKGKLEKGELPEEAGVREVQEECNVTCQITDPNPLISYHIYGGKKDYILKKTYWYSMSALGNQKCIAQEEEGITEVGFYSKNDLDTKLSSSFLNLQDLMQRYYLK